MNYDQGFYQLCYRIYLLINYSYKNCSSWEQGHTVIHNHEQKFISEQINKNFKRYVCHHHYEMRKKYLSAN